MQGTDHICDSVGAATLSDTISNSSNNNDNDWVLQLPSLSLSTVLNVPQNICRKATTTIVFDTETNGKVTPGRSI